MIINDKDALARLNNPNNLINRLKSQTGRSGAMGLFGIGRKTVDISVKKEDKKDDDGEIVKTTFNPFTEIKIQTQEKAEIIISEPKESDHSNPKIDDLIDNNDSTIKLGLAHDNALSLLTDSLSALRSKLDDVKADKLPSVIAAASKTVESIRRERADREKNNKDRDVHFHFYTPEQKKLSDYTIIDTA